MAEELTGADPGWVRTLAEDGYCLRRGALTESDLEATCAEFDRLVVEHPNGVDQRQLLTSPVFLNLLHHPSVLGAAQELFGHQCQLLMYALRHGCDPNGGAARRWHRDFNFVWTTSTARTGELRSFRGRTGTASWRHLAVSRILGKSPCRSVPATCC